MDVDDMDIDSAWSNFCEDEIMNSMTRTLPKPTPTEAQQELITGAEFIPKCSALNISTKTKICYLNTPIDLKEVFWRIPLVKYYDPRVGVVKKQMKFNSDSPEEVDAIQKHKLAYDYVDDYLLKQVSVTNGRNKFKDIRKISIGVCRKDITSYRCKRKSAFYNCFVVILRLFHEGVFKEINVKVFNTGKLGISGIQDAFILNKVLDLLVVILTPILKPESLLLAPETLLAPDADSLLAPAPAPLAYLDEKSETVMINSNFSCGYYINREKMYKLLKYKYKINSNFDSCSYPGIQCEFYYDSLLGIQTGIQPTASDTKQAVKVSFMIFRTGSVLIVGKCTEEMLYEIYNFLCNIFETEYDAIKCAAIHEPLVAKKGGADLLKEKERKIRRKTVTLGVGGAAHTPHLG